MQAADKSFDSSGIGDLVAAYTTVTNRGGTMEFRNLPSWVGDILSITKNFIDTDFPDFPNFSDGFAY